METKFEFNKDDFKRKEVWSNFGVFQGSILEITTGNHVFKVAVFVNENIVLFSSFIFHLSPRNLFLFHSEFGFEGIWLSPEICFAGIIWEWGAMLRLIFSWTACYSWEFAGNSIFCLCLFYVWAFFFRLFCKSVITVLLQVVVWLDIFQIFDATDISGSTKMFQTEQPQNNAASRRALCPKGIHTFNVASSSNAFPSESSVLWRQDWDRNPQISLSGRKSAHIIWFGMNVDKDFSFSFCVRKYSVIKTDIRKSTKTRID